MVLERFTIGQMRSSVEFFVNAATVNATTEREAVTTGGRNDSYVSLLTTRGRLRKKNGNRGLDLGLIESKETYELICRFQSTLESSLATDVKLVIDSKVFTIASWEKIDEIKHFYKFELNASSENVPIAEQTLGAELIANGTFTTNLNGWVAGTGWAWDSNTAKFTNVSGPAPFYQLGVLSTTTYYRVSFDVVTTNGFVAFQFGNNRINAVVGTNTFDGYWANVLGHGGITTYFMPSADFDGYIDNVSVKEIIQ